MARDKTESVVKRHERAWSVRDQWYSQLKEAYELALPMRNLMGGNAAGDTKMDKVFDSTLMLALARFANKMQSQVTPPFQKWGNFVAGILTPPDEKLERNKELAMVRDAVFSYLQVSNFDTAAHEYYLELGIGTAALLFLKGTKENPFRFIPVPQSQIALEEGVHTAIGAVYRRHSIKRRLIQPTWENMWDNPPDGFDKWVSDNPDSEEAIIEATYQDVDNPEIWHFDVILPDQSDLGGEDKDVRLVEEDFDENPWIITRWIKVVGEAHGRGPVLYALPDAKTLNKAKELLLKNASLNISGVWTAVDDGVLNPYKVKFKPGIVIPVGRNASQGTGPSLMNHPVGQNFNLTQFIFGDLQESIKRAMLDDELPRVQEGVRSASEFVARMSQSERDVGSPFARTFREWVRPLMQRAVNILVELDLLPEEGKIKFDGLDADVQIVSPLAGVQNLKDIQATTDYLAILGQVLGPQATAMGVKLEDLPEWLATKMGVDANLVRDSEERGELEEFVGQFAEQQQAAAASASQGEAQPAQVN